MGKITKISGATNVVLILLLIIVLLVIFAFKGYSLCACDVKFDDERQVYFTDCPTEGLDFWDMVNAGLTNVCPGEPGYNPNPLVVWRYPLDVSLK